jgi:hypothetical protein
MSNNKKQTAVEWLQVKMATSSSEEIVGNINLWFKQAKAMENEQHGNTWDAAIQAHEDRGHVIARSLTDFDEYYNETFNSNEA